MAEFSFDDLFHGSAGAGLTTSLSSSSGSDGSLDSPKPMRLNCSIEISNTPYVSPRSRRRNAQSLNDGESDDDNDDNDNENRGERRRVAPSASSALFDESRDGGSSGDDIPDYSLGTPSKTAWGAHIDNIPLRRSFTLSGNKQDGGDIVVTVHPDGGYTVDFDAEVGDGSLGSTTTVVSDVAVAATSTSLPTGALAGSGSAAAYVGIAAATRPRPSVSFDDFKVLCVLGKGAFGKVFQVERKSTSEIYAMKVLKKDFLKETNNVSYTQAECNILRKIRHPFIVSLHFAFQSMGRLYLVMDYVNGGQLFQHLRDQGMFSEDLTRFYIAEIILGLEHLHHYGIIHRDLKPENILVQGDGHIAITDFGLAKEDLCDLEKTDTFCGTVEYMAPEMIKGDGYDKSADWWSVGVLLFDMLTGGPPFKHKNEGTLRKKILQDKIKVPAFLSSSVKSLLSKLLIKNPDKRLGSKASGGVAALKKHSFFKSINWNKMLAMDVQPPFRPEVSRGKRDTSNFDLLPLSSSHLDEGFISRSHEDYFLGFSYCRTPGSPPSDLNMHE
eukprot:TRINITY_DN5203_c0_g1_i1.p1 TRINITY_DN5203_c0_g1~~TRINITY_DN5203_c0_g1_i1.p1  ORF type:complete len:554 (-),score=146.43 TRINITY_DN5203_c0_g1_i1:259-1920(-)